MWVWLYHVLSLLRIIASAMADLQKPTSINVQNSASYGDHVVARDKVTFSE